MAGWKIIMTLRKKKQLLYLQHFPSVYQRAFCECLVYVFFAIRTGAQKETKPCEAKVNVKFSRRRMGGWAVSPTNDENPRCFSNWPFCRRDFLQFTITHLGCFQILLFQLTVKCLNKVSLFLGKLGYRHVKLCKFWMEG